MDTLRNRIIGHAEVPASQIVGAPWNWRDHGARQRRAIAGSLAELGIYESLRVRQLEDGRFELFDGHARRDLIEAEVGPDTLIPVEITDLDEEEAKKANATHDPIAAMATANRAKIAELASQISVSNEPLRLLVQKISKTRTRPVETSDAPQVGEAGAAEPVPERKVPKVEARFPLAIVLDLDGLRRWKRFKADVGYQSDERAFNAAMERYGDTEAFKVLMSRYEAHAAAEEAIA